MKEKNIESTLKNNDGAGDEHSQRMVTIYVNEQPKEIHRGSTTIGEIKALFNISAADKLAMFDDDGNLGENLEDNFRITIKGGEKFRRIPGSGQSS